MALRIVRNLVLFAVYFKFNVSGQDFNNLEPDGSFSFGYNNPDSYHRSQGNRNNVVRGDFGSRNPATGAIDSIQYTAGPRGFRPRGKNVARQYDFNQVRTGPIGSRDDPNFDPNEDPSYNFAFNTRTYTRQEAANRVGDVTGKFSYLDDIGERHNVEFIAGKNTGFHVRSPVPDNKPLPFSPIQYVGKRKPVPRGRTTVQRGLDGSYRFVSGGPDHRRTETSDSTGHVRGSYTYLDDKGVRHSVHYIAGPETGYRVLKNVKGPHLPTIYPFSGADIVPPNFYNYPLPDDVFDTAATGLVNPNKNGLKPSKDQGGGTDDFNYGSGDDFFGGRPNFGSSAKKPNRPSYEDDGSDLGDIFDTPSKGGSGRPNSKGGSGDSDDGSYKPSGEDGSYRPDQTGGGGLSKPGSKPDGDGVTGSGGTGGRPSGFGGQPDDDYGDYGGRPTGDSKPSDFGMSSQTGEGSSGGTSKPNRPNYGSMDGSSANDGFNLFDTGPATGGDSGAFSSAGGGPVYEGNAGKFGASGGGFYNDGGSSSGGGTLVTNIGDRLFSVPPGASVRAHVQAIDLLPLRPRSLSPSEQLKMETKELKAENSDNKEQVTNSENKEAASDVLPEK
ncbi:hypothetical protein PPYR_09268 [Photinus pyralis]|uniref:Uncharacterized protein n=2 Tax=Photinus pyralis TaxID=7054 RepID=A0A5N4ALN7_PHOPY|nr:uncharacterized protein LOC116171957 [Photinus pyralis]KAB0798275.1 hypothetical protein PPYR_09268 [Photinus pyralis]